MVDWANTSDSKVEDKDISDKLKQAKIPVNCFVLCVSTVNCVLSCVLRLSVLVLGRYAL
jgi:hypothetical protein